MLQCFPVSSSDRLLPLPTMPLFLILALIAIFGGIYFAAWCLCAVQRNHKEGHYILEEVDDELYQKKLYTGLGN